MRIAISNWQGRISPVFDVARNLLLVDIENGQELGRSGHKIVLSDPLAQARQVAELGTNVLICGAVSWPLEMALIATGVKVAGRICGPVEEVLKAFIQGQLRDDTFLMPGCHSRRRRFRGGCQQSQQ